jgi:flagellar hook-length control protein FliK
MAGAITKLSIDVFSPMARGGFPGAAPRDNAYAQVAKAVNQNAAGGSAVPTKNENVDQGKMSAASQSSTTGKPDSRTGDASSDNDGDIANGNALVIEADSADTALTDGASVEIDPELAQKQATSELAEVTAEAALKQAGLESSAVDLDGSEITLTDNRGGITLENQIDKKSLGATSITATRGDATAAISGKLIPGANAATDAAADGMRQSERMASEADMTADSRRSVSAEPSLRGSAEGKLASGDGSAMAKLLAAEMQSADSRPATSSGSDATPLTPLGQSPSPLAVKPAAALVELALPTRLGDPGWQEGLSGRVSMMVNQRIGVATIRMNPPELGPIEVKVNLNHDQARVQFVSHAVQVRDALEQSIPRLREMLEQSGFTLVDSQVSDQSPQQQQQEQQQTRGRSEAPVGGSDLAAQITTHEAVGLIDYYA